MRKVKWCKNRWYRLQIHTKIRKRRVVSRRGDDSVQLIGVRDAEWPMFGGGQYPANGALDGSTRITGYWDDPEDFTPQELHQLAQSLQLLPR